MDELMDALNEAENVSGIYYSKDTMMWVVQYKEGSPPNVLHPVDLIDFLENG